MKNAILKISITFIFVIATVIAIAKDSIMVGCGDVNETGLRGFKYAGINQAYNQSKYVSVLFHQLTA